MTEGFTRHQSVDLGEIHSKQYTMCNSIRIVNTIYRNEYILSLVLNEILLNIFLPLKEYNFKYFKCVFLPYCY